MAGSTNFQIFNPGSVNQDTDSAYTSDSLRSGGITLDAILPSTLLNKFFYQQSTWSTAWATALANQIGAAVDDTNFSTLEAQIAAFIASAIGKAPLQTVSFTPTPAFNATSFNGFEMTLTGNVTSSTLSGFSDGQTIVFVIKQDATGGRTFVPPSNVHGWQTINPAANSYSVQSFIVDNSGNVEASASAFDSGFLASLTANGYMQIPIFGVATPLVIMWGKSASSGGSGVAVTFPNGGFNNAVFTVLVNPTGTTASNYVWTNAVTVTGFNLVNNGTSPQAFWIAIGF